MIADMIYEQVLFRLLEERSKLVSKLEREGKEEEDGGWIHVMRERDGEKSG